MATSIVDQAKEDQTHSSMMAWRVHEFGPPSVMRFEFFGPLLALARSLSKLKPLGSVHGTAGLGPKERFAATAPSHAGLGSVW
jgi:hypothetical protein